MLKARSALGWLRLPCCLTWRSALQLLSICCRRVTWRNWRTKRFEDNKDRPRTCARFCAWCSKAGLHQFCRPVLCICCLCCALQYFEWVKYCQRDVPSCPGLIEVILNPVAFSQAAQEHHNHHGSGVADCGHSGHEHLGPCGGAAEDRRPRAGLLECAWRCAQHCECPASSPIRSCLILAVVCAHSCVSATGRSPSCI